MLYKDIEVNIL